MRSGVFQDFAGEFIGTAILVFFGCSSVAVSILFSANAGLMQIAMVWGTAVTLAIYSTRHLSCAHLNPAVSLAMVAAGRMRITKLPAYVGGQFLGAFAAAALLYALFDHSIAHFEALHHIVRGAHASVQTAMMFGEFYPNPGAGSVVSLNEHGAFLAEMVGTFALVFMIFNLTEGCNLGRPDNALAPIFIGATVTVIISVIAPLTQAGLNPARDLSPRLFSMLAGWGTAAVQGDGLGSITVYVVGPILGALMAAYAFTGVVEPLMKNKPCESCVTKGEERHVHAES